MKVNIRNVRMSDLDEIVDIEKQCFPIGEAAGREEFQKRIIAFSDNFLVAEYKGKLVGFINGSTTESSVIFDEMYHDIEYHNTSGHNIAIFGLDVIKEFRGLGIAAQLIQEFLDKARIKGKKSVILTCKLNLAHYYTRFGFVNNGISKSVHGGATWYDMSIEL